MKALILESSPHLDGASALLASSFSRGAQKKGIEVEKIDLAHSSIHPCMACDACFSKKRCVQKDDVPEILDKILAADFVVFVTPVYYFQLSSQLKILIDRFYSINDTLSAKHLKTVLIATCWDDHEATMRPLKEYYELLCDYLHFENRGSVLALGCGNRVMAEKTIYPATAEKLGESL